MKTGVKGENRFENDASRYAAYLDTPEGRLRTDLTLANLQDVWSALGERNVRVLDIGCGTGAAGIHLARLGFDVTILDSSPPMLDLARRAIIDAGVSDKILVKHGDAAELEDAIGTERFDVVLCHNVLEYVADPAAILHAAASVLRDASAILSVLVRNQAGEVLKAALQAGDLAAAENALAAEWGRESLYDGDVRLFTPEALEAMLQAASLAVIGRKGVRVIADYLPERISRSAEYDRIFALERKLSNRPEFFSVARYMQFLARPGASTRGG